MDNVECARCNSVNDFSTEKQAFQNGTTHIKATCNKCGKFIKWLPQSEEKTYLPFGKYRGQHTYQVTDIDYLKWLLNIITDDRLKSGVQKRIKELTSGGGHG